MHKGLAFFLFWASCGFAAPPALERAEALYSKADFTSAIKLLDGVQKDARAWALLGKAQYGEGNYKAAVKALKEAVEAMPENAQYWNWLGKSYGQLAATGSALRAFGRARSCGSAFEKAVELDGKDLEALNDLFSFYLDAPGLLGGGVDKAEALAERIGALDAAEHEYILARLARKHKDYASAEEHFRKAMEMEPERVGRVLDLASFLAEQGRFEESDALFAKAAERKAESPKVLFSQARALIKAKRHPGRAKRLLEEYLAADLTAEDPPRHEARQLLKRVKDE